MNLDEIQKNSRSRWHFSRKIKILTALIIIVVILSSIFIFMQHPGTTVVQGSSNSTVTATPSATPYSNNTYPSNEALGNIAEQIRNFIYPGPTAAMPRQPPGLIETHPVINSSVWRTIAANAWAFYKNDWGVDQTTGLPYAGGSDFKAFTDWDLGVYIQSIMDAQKIGLIDMNNATARLNKTLTFLETRPLNNDSYPYQFYDATTAKRYGSGSNVGIDLVDTGRLFVALNNVRSFNSTLAQRVNNIVMYGRSNYTAIVPGIKSDSMIANSIYAYYYESGFAGFWPDQIPNMDTILDNIFNSGNISSYGVALPKASISCDPLLCSFFELNSNNPKLVSLVNEVYAAHEAYYNATGEYVAFSEGSGPSGFIWEWVVLPNGDTWKVQDASNLGTTSYLNINPIVFNKVAFSFLAIFNTTYARNTTIFLEQNLSPSENGYYEGATDTPTPELALTLGSNTNGLILDAALYALQKTM